MTESEKPALPEDLNEWDQVHLALGQYTVAFSHLEGTVTLFTSITMQKPYSELAFIARDMPFYMRSRLLRRAGADLLPKDLSESLNSILNKANKASEFRNDIAHGAFVHDDEFGITLVKDGNSSSAVWEGREPIDYATLTAEAAKLYEISKDLSEWSMRLTKWRNSETKKPAEGSNEK